MNLFKFSLTNINYKHIYIYVVWISLWTSLGSNPNDIYNIKNLELENLFSKQFLISIINFLRSLAPLLFLILNIFFFRKKIFSSKINIFIIFIILFQIPQLVGSIFEYQNMKEKEILTNYIGRHYWLLLCFATISTYLISKKIKYFKSINLIFISIFFIGIIVVFFGTKTIVEFLNFQSAAYHLHVDRDSGFFLNHYIPRITGISRSISILYVFILFFFKENSSQKIFWKYALILILGSIIMLFQSKFSVVVLLVINLLYFCTRNTNYEKKIYSLILIIFFQILLTYTISYSRIYNENLVIPSDKIIKNLETEQVEIQKKELKLEHFRQFDLSYTYTERIIWFFSSGRFILWKNSFKHFLKAPIFGYGPMADRVLNLPSSTPNTWNPDERLPVSNAFIYSGLSGGVFFLIIVLAFWYKIFIKIYPKFFALIKNKKILFYDEIALYLFMILFLRSIIENSYLAYGIDFIVLVHSIDLITTKKRGSSK